MITMTELAGNLQRAAETDTAVMAELHNKVAARCGLTERLDPGATPVEVAGLFLVLLTDLDVLDNMAELLDAYPKTIATQPITEGF